MVVDYSKFDIKEILAEDFSLKIICLVKFLRDNYNEKIISNQILRSATSIGAHISEAKYGESKADFTHKLVGAQKEANETLYWLRLLYRGKYLDEEKFDTLYLDCLKIMKILSNITTKLKK